MKHPILFLSLVLLSTLFSCNSGSENSSQNADSTKTTNEINPNLKLQVYYFHSTMRCKTCNAIEATVKKTIDTFYENEITNGVISFKSINVDEEANKALAEKYLAYGSALHLIAIENGEEKDNDLTEFAFSNIYKDNDAFSNSLKDTIQTLIQ
jgi:hypothetical protein